MKKTDLGVDINSLHECCMQNGTFYAYFKVNNDVDDLGRPLECLLDVGYNAFTNEVTFGLYSEDEDGDAETEDVSSMLYAKTKKQLTEKTKKAYKDFIC